MPGQQQQHNFSHQSKRLSDIQGDDRHLHQTSGKVNRPISGPFPPGMYYPHDATAVPPEKLPWNMFPGQINSLADAYGASHGQPQAGAPNLDWMNGMAASMLVDPAAQAHPYGNYMMAQNSLPSNMHAFSPQLLAHQMAQMQLQNLGQGHDQVAAQQNLLLLQIQQAQAQRSQMEGSYAVWNQPPIHQELPPNLASRESVTLDGSAHPSTFVGIEAADPSKVTQQQLHPDLMKALSAMDAIRQQYHNRHVSAEKKQSSASRSPRPHSFAGRDSRDSSRPTTPMRFDTKRQPSQQRNVTPSIVIDQINVESTDEDLERKANSVGMRIGPRIATVVHEVAPTDTLSYCSNTSERVSSRNPETTRHATIQGAAQPIVIQPRRQPRGPPTESFFANNFLARRSLRTRREAMSKLCASPRAPSFGNPRHSAPPSSLSKPL